MVGLWDQEGIRGHGRSRGPRGNQKTCSLAKTSSESEYTDAFKDQHSDNACLDSATGSESEGGCGQSTVDSCSDRGSNKQQSYSHRTIQTTVMIKNRTFIFSH
jgi:hypothetical protein